MASKVDIIAEIGSVHDGSIGNALQLVKVASECGASSVKLQAHNAEAETLQSAPNPRYFNQESRFEYFKRTAFTQGQWETILSECDVLGIDLIVSPFSIEAVEMLENVGVERYKIASGEVSNVPMLERIAETRKPVVLSSGMSSWQELDRAFEALRHLCNVSVLQCTSEYPCPAKRVGLNVIAELMNRYEVPVGLSDHTMGCAASLSAITMGATLVERHLTFSRKMYGSDAAHSLEPREFRRFLIEVRELEEILANPVDKESESLREVKMVFEKSIVASRKLKKGQLLRLEDLAFKKPGSGIPAWRYKEVIGREISVTVKKDSLIRWEWVR